MADLESDSESRSPPVSSDPAALGLLRDVAHVPPVPGALHQVELPSALRAALGDVPAATERPETPRPGAIIAGRYRLDHVLGSGGMGVVFAAHHLQTDKAVALKWLPLSRGQRGSRDRAHALARFAREARAAGRIRHPNVVDVYDASSDEDTPFLVMERLEGETLRARIQRAPLSWDELIALLVPAMRGVAELHRQGIVHRDLKPDNVFLACAPGSSEPCAKVLDFGVSLLRSRDSVEDSLTGTGAIVGTPSYMPLEQLRGDDSVDERTDVYALGVVLFEALTGRRPWQARSAAEYGALLATERPTRLSALRPELKGLREAVIMKALEREPGQRHASVEAFIAELLSASARRPLRAPWLVLGVVLCVGAAAFTAWRARPSLRERAQERGTPAAEAQRTVAVPGAPLELPAAALRMSAQDAAPEPMEAATSTPKAPSRSSQPPAKRALRPAPRTPTSESALDSLSPDAPRVPVAEPTDRATSLSRDEF